MFISFYIEQIHTPQFTACLHPFYMYVITRGKVQTIHSSLNQHEYEGICLHCGSEYVLLPRLAFQDGNV